MVKNIVSIIPKPWGSEEIFARTDKYVGKILYINVNSKLSLQYHNKKTETIRVLSGLLHLVTSNGQGFQDTYLSEGDTVHITPGMVHRFCADEQPVVLVEVSTPELDDVVRLEDNYGRVEVSSKEVIVPRVSIEVYMLHDIVDRLPDDIYNIVDDAIDNKVSFGDAEYTIIKGSFLERIIHDGFKESGDYTDDAKMEIIKEIPSLVNALIAING